MSYTVFTRDIRQQMQDMAALITICSARSMGWESNELRRTTEAGIYASV